MFTTIVLLFPLWVFQEELQAVFGALPPYWILVSAPIILFLLVYVVPFFVGTYQHQHRVRSLLEWRRRWLERVQELLNLPEGGARSRGLEESSHELVGEQNRLVSERGLYTFLVYIGTGGHEGNLKEVLSAGPETTAGPLSRLEEMKAEIGNPSWAPMVTVIWEARAEFPMWDALFRHTYRISEIHEIIEDTGLEGMSDFVTVRVKEVDRELEQVTARKNFIAGAIVTGLSSLVVWLFKVFEDDLLELIRKLT